MICRTFTASSLEYKRDSHYVASPLRYPGGKYYALKFIMPFILCVPHDEYREPFLGGGNVFFAKQKSTHNWINDLDEDLMIFYKVISDACNRNLLNEKFIKEIANRERHSVLKDLVPQDDLEAAFRTYYLNRTSYSGIINKPAWGYADGKSSPPQNWPKMITSAGMKLKDVKITSLDFEEIIKAPAVGKTTFMYLDPPYYWADQKRAYIKHFTLKDHLRLADILKQTKHFFCLSYDDCQEVRDLYSWAQIYPLSWLYNTANKKGKSRKVGSELAICNYKVAFEENLQISL